MVSVDEMRKRPLQFFVFVSLERAHSFKIVFCACVFFFSFNYSSQLIEIGVCLGELLNINCMDDVNGGILCLNILLGPSLRLNRFEFGADWSKLLLLLLQ